MRVVTGAFHDKDKASEAIQELVAAGVPKDEIRMEVTEPGGGEHPVAVIRTSPTRKGGILGGAIGAALGAVGATLVANDVIAGPGLLMASGPLLTVLQGALAGAGAGFAVGVLGSITPLLWKEEAVVEEKDLARGTALVSVHSDEMHDTARKVLGRVGADRVN